MKLSIFPLTAISLLSMLLVLSLGPGRAFAEPTAASEPLEFESIAAGLERAPHSANPTPDGGQEQVLGILAASTSITLPAAKDNTLYESETGALSNGSGEYFFAGKTNQGRIRRGLVGFDLAAEIPAGSTIVSAEVDLYMSKTIAGAVDISLHPYLQEWGEGASDGGDDEGAGADAEAGDATWLHTFFNTDTWDNAGGDFTADPSATTAVDDIGHYQWSSPALAQDLQACLEAESDSCGWLVMGKEDQDATAKRFSSRENPQASERPQLTVEYIAPLPQGISFVPIIITAD